MLLSEKIQKDSMEFEVNPIVHLRWEPISGTPLHDYALWLTIELEVRLDTDEEIDFPLMLENNSRIKHTIIFSWCLRFGDGNNNSIMKPVKSQIKVKAGADFSAKQVKTLALQALDYLQQNLYMTIRLLMSCVCESAIEQAQAQILRRPINGELLNKLYKQLVEKPLRASYDLPISKGRPKGSTRYKNPDTFINDINRAAKKADTINLSRICENMKRKDRTGGKYGEGYGKGNRRLGMGTDVFTNNCKTLGLHRDNLIAYLCLNKTLPPYEQLPQNLKLPTD